MEKMIETPVDLPVEIKPEKFKTKCKLCGHPIKTDKSKMREMGDTCFNKIHKKGIEGLL